MKCGEDERNTDDIVDEQMAIMYRMLLKINSEIRTKVYKQDKIEMQEMSQMVSLKYSTHKLMGT